MAQLEAFQAKIGKIKEELGGQKLVLPAAAEVETLEAELAEMDKDLEPAGEDEF